jgi:hypothetical protein
MYGYYMQNQYVLPANSHVQPHPGVPGLPQVPTSQIGFGNQAQFMHRPQVPPADATQLRKQVASQLDYYFSVENLVKDSFLRSLMDDAGYVNLTDMLTFRKLASLTTDIPFILESLKDSTVVEVTDLKVRRREHPEHFPRIPAPAVAPAYPQFNPYVQMAFPQAQRQNRQPPYPYPTQQQRPAQQFHHPNNFAFNTQAPTFVPTNNTTAQVPAVPPAVAQEQGQQSETENSVSRDVVTSQEPLSREVSTAQSSEQAEDDDDFEEDAEWIEAGKAAARAPKAKSSKPTSSAVSTSSGQSTKTSSRQESSKVDSYEQ